MGDEKEKLQQCGVEFPCGAADEGSRVDTAVAQVAAVAQGLILGWATSACCGYGQKKFRGIVF